MVSPLFEMEIFRVRVYVPAGMVPPASILASMDPEDDVEDDELEDDDELDEDELEDDELHQPDVDDELEDDHHWA